MKREITLPAKPLVASGTEKPPREKRKLSLKFGGARDVTLEAGR